MFVAMLEETQSWSNPDSRDSGIGCDLILVYYFFFDLLVWVLGGGGRYFLHYSKKYQNADCVVQPAEL